MGAAIRGRLVGRLGLFLASVQVTGSSGCTADHAGPDPARQNGDHREVAADTAVVHPHVADLVDDDGHLAGAYVRGPRLVRHSEVLGVLHEPGSAQADHNPDNQTCLVWIRYYRDTGEVISITVLACWGDSPRRGGGPGRGGSGDDEEGECGDERDVLVAEYTRLGRSGWPCEKFQNSVSSAHFSWSELNDGWSGGNESSHRPWGYIDAKLIFGLEETRMHYGRGGIRISSGYRCPDGNRTLPRASATSPHMDGLAADMFSANHPWTQAEFNRLRAAAKKSGGRGLFWNSYTDHHLHVSWRK